MYQRRALTATTQFLFFFDKLLTPVISGIEPGLVTAWLPQNESITSLLDS